MENSANSCSDAKMEDCPEESSWTYYVQCFICENDEISYSDDESPSLVSDAASSAVKKLPLAYIGTFNSSKTNQKYNTNNISCEQNSNFKKQKITQVAALDHDLEDTASSPVNSPKICFVNPFTKRNEKANKMDFAEVKRNIFGMGGSFTVESDRLKFEDKHIS